MKKIFTLALAAVAAMSISAQTTMQIWVNNKVDYERNLTEIDSITFVRNNPPQQEQLTSLSIDPASLTMTLGESVRLNAVYVPKEAKVTLKWSSSDEEVATVSSNGTITALNNGEATILLEAGGKKATCEIKVITWEETINFTDCYLYDYKIDSTNLVYTTYIDDKFGNLKVTFADLKFILFSEGFGYQNDGKLGGTKKGAMAEWNTKIMVAAVADNKDNAAFVEYMGTNKLVTWTLKAYYVNKDTVHQTIPGAVDIPNYVANMKDVIKAVNEQSATKYGEYIKKAAANITGAVVNIYEYDTDEGNYSSNYLPEGLFLKGSWAYTTGKKTASSQYMLKLDYSELAVDYFKNDKSHYYGIVLETQDDDTYKVVSNEVQFKETIHYKYGEAPMSNAPMNMQRIILPDQNDAEWLKIRQAVDNFKANVKMR